MFNQAYNIYHYHWGQLSIESISTSIIVKVFDWIELLDKLKAIKESNLFIDLEFDYYKIK